MTQEQIKSSNKTIAESPFASEGVKRRLSHFVDVGNEIGLNKYLSILKYHSSWDWLMPVVEKIESGLFYAEIKEKGCVIAGYRKYASVMFVRKEATKTKLQSTFDAVVDFITWYNQNK